jgi:hypothetical protein
MVSNQRKRAVVACFRMIPVYSIPRFSLVFLLCCVLLLLNLSWNCCLCHLCYFIPSFYAFYYFGGFPVSLIFKVLHGTAICIIHPNPQSPIRNSFSSFLNFQILFPFHPLTGNQPCREEAPLEEGAHSAKEADGAGTDYHQSHLQNGQVRVMPLFWGILARGGNAVVLFFFAVFEKFFS